MRIMAIFAIASVVIAAPIEDSEGRECDPDIPEGCYHGPHGNDRVCKFLLHGKLTVTE